MGADADHDQPLIVAFLDPGLIGCRIGQARTGSAAGLVDLLRGERPQYNFIQPHIHLHAARAGRGRRELPSGNSPVSIS